METYKLIIGTISGFAIAFFSEPIKLYFSHRFKKKQLRKGLYAEMLQMYTQLNAILVLYKNGKIPIENLTLNLEKVSYGLYEFAKKDPLIFYDLEEALVFDTLYKNFFTTMEQLKKMSDQDAQAKLAWPELSQLSFEKIVEDNRLDRAFIKSMLKNSRNDYIKGLLEKSNN